MKFLKTLYLLRKYNKERNAFTKYVVCKNVILYIIFKIVLKDQGFIQHTKLCVYQEFSNHPYHRMRARCNNPFLKTVELTTGKKMFYPFLTYCYLGLTTLIPLLFNQHNFYELLINSHKRFHPSSTLDDVYNGRIWSDFQNYERKLFF